MKRLSVLMFALLATCAIAQVTIRQTLRPQKVKMVRQEAATMIDLAIVPSLTVVEPGGDIAVDLVLSAVETSSDAKAIFAQFVIKYDPEVLEFVSVSAVEFDWAGTSIFHSGAIIPINADLQDGDLYMIAMTYKPIIMPTDGLIAARLIFRARDLPEIAASKVALVCGVDQPCEFDATNPDFIVRTSTHGGFGMDCEESVIVVVAPL